MSGTSKVHGAQNGPDSCVTLLGILIKWATTPKVVSKTNKGKNAACMQLTTQIETLEGRRVALENSANGCRHQIERWQHMGANKPRPWTIRATVERALEFDKQARIALAMQKGLQKQQLMVENAQMNEDSVDLLHVSRRIMAQTGVGKYNIDDVVDAQDLIAEMGDDIAEMTTILGGTSDISDEDVQQELDRLMREDVHSINETQPANCAVSMNQTPDEIMKVVMDIVISQAHVHDLPNVPSHALVSDLLVVPKPTQPVLVLAEHPVSKDAYILPTVPQSLLRKTPLVSSSTTMLSSLF